MLRLVLQFIANARAAAKAIKDNPAPRNRARTRHMQNPVIKLLNQYPLTANEFENAKHNLIVIAQTHLEQDYSKAYANLTPFKLPNGIIIAGGRMEKANVE